MKISNSTYYPSICEEKLRKNRKNPTQHSWCPERYSKGESSNTSLEHYRSIKQHVTSSETLVMEEEFVHNFSQESGRANTAWEI
jgi:hypothetical protein